MNANVKRAVSASLDVIDARRRKDSEDVYARLFIEALSLEALEGPERFDYEVGLSHAYQQVVAQHAG